MLEEVIPTKRQVPFLGAIIDQDLSLEEQAGKVVKKMKVLSSLPGKDWGGRN